MFLTDRSLAGGGAGCDHDAAQREEEAGARVGRGQEPQPPRDQGRRLSQVPDPETAILKLKDSEKCE